MSSANLRHHPYGMDDPYKPLTTERFPKSPTPEDKVQIGFEAEAQTAWVTLKSGQSEERYPAQRWHGDTWLALLEKLDPGSYQYWIHARQQDTEEVVGPYALEIGRWLTVKSIADIQVATYSVTLLLNVEGREQPASLSLSFPQAGVCRFSFSSTTPETAQGLACNVVQQGQQVLIQSAGLELSLDTSTLHLQAKQANKDFVFQSSLKLRWLETLAAEVLKIETGFDTESTEHLYGLGERFVGPNLKGKIWDTRVYEEYKEQGQRSYLPVPFLISSKSYGVWLDTAHPALFDLQNNHHTISLETLPTTRATVSWCLLLGNKPYDVTSLFTKLTGNITLPPKWAFGPWMSANTWNNQSKTEEVVKRTLHEDIPATVLVLEAWSDESTFYIFNDAQYTASHGSEKLSLKDFQFTGRWTDPKTMIDYCHQNGIRVLLWQIPVHKKLDEPHAQHDADGKYLLEQNFAIQNEDGTPYHNKGWWFTHAFIPDFTNPKARDWWLSKRQYLFEDLGIDGMKTDGGEHLWGRNLKAHDGSRGIELVNSFVHHYISSYYDFIQKQTKGDGLTFSRAGYTGAQRYPAHWAGDENSTWSAFKASILAGLSAGLSGVSMWAWDIGGFSGEIPTLELYLRSVAMACFCPIMQYHSELHQSSDNRERSPWNIAERHNDPRALSVYRNYAKLRMRLLDYIYEEARVLSEHGLPLMRLPELEYPEVHALLSQDSYSYLFGRDLLICPVLEKGASSRIVRLPPGDWADFWSGQILSGNRTINVPAPLELIPVFIKADSPRLNSLLEARG